MLDAMKCIYLVAVGVWVLGGQRMMCGVLLYHFPPYSHEAGFLTEPVFPCLCPHSAGVIGMCS